MSRLIVTRVISMGLAIFTVLTVLFFGIRPGVGDPTTSILGTYAAFVSLINLLIDIAYPIIDPRIRYE